ncbi:MAG: BufA2 family periplasmic bufferin-type metallophore [Candidatus Binataceae bacterium]
MDKMKLTGAVLATAVGLMFMAQPLVLADDASGAQVKCVAGNSCKGQSSCKSASNSCKGQNSCKGKGWVMTTSTQACTQAGGHVES